MQHAADAGRLERRQLPLVLRLASAQLPRLSHHKPQPAVSRAPQTVSGNKSAAHLCGIQPHLPSLGGQLALPQTIQPFREQIKRCSQPTSAASSPSSSASVVSLCSARSSSCSCRCRSASRCSSSCFYSERGSQQRMIMYVRSGEGEASQCKAPAAALPRACAKGQGQSDGAEHVEHARMGSPE